MILPYNDESAVVISDIFRNGGTVVLPTDTIYGISGSVPVSRQKIMDIKGRSETKPFIQLIACPDDIQQFTDCAVPPKLLAFWPGPLSIIVPIHGGGTVAFRCPGDSWLRNIITLTGTPIYSTSVNAAGEPSLVHIHDIIEKFADRVDAIIDGGDCATSIPSTIVSLAGDKPVIIRAGAVTNLERTGLF